MFCTSRVLPLTSISGGRETRPSSRRRKKIGAKNGSADDLHPAGAYYNALYAPSTFGATSSKIRFSDAVPFFLFFFSPSSPFAATRRRLECTEYRARSRSVHRANSRRDRPQFDPLPLTYYKILRRALFSFSHSPFAKRISVKSMICIICIRYEKLATFVGENGAKGASGFSLSIFFLNSVHSATFGGL